ncbi:MAG: FAD-dependent oxidoreductase [Desulfarculaceae bacterium]|nr:FAD-dependent oxidoreductase [Desulfarculaceae bacterium]MCF8070768.1 FAD-dependent oxidoreductase [Desulfarculaceae bacterium]MCF8102205.1 FAD-dependent oxidoreductase [Desulfarculaceae bacterium]MCF8116996.1 FAD-dependent oxidoreductase [Desulfarculaceae bacterium]
MRINLLEALSDNIKINKDKCTACGVCVDTCILDNLRLKLAPCRRACPLGVNCQGYVQLVLRGEDQAALEMARRELPFPGILGRLCSAQCEDACERRAETGSAVAIRALKRYVAEAGGRAALPDKAPASGKSVAVVGSGPAGMMAAWNLLLKGHAVTVFDAAPEPGGMLRWAVPVFRLPEQVLADEWGQLLDLGAVFKGDQALGRELSLEKLSAEHDAVIVAVGCPRPKRLNLEGEDAGGVHHALELLRQVRSGEAPTLSGKVVVVGGGEVALDASQSALRLGAAQVTMVSLEDRMGMLASPEALGLAQAEGVVLDPSWGPSRIMVEDGKVSGLELMRCLAVLDSQGNFAPSFDDCQLKTVQADAVIVAIGQEREPGLPCKPADPATLQGDLPNLFLAGDALGGPGTIVQAMASGRQAAESAHRLVTGQHLTFGRAYPGPVETEFEIDPSRGSDAPRAEPPVHRLNGPGDFAELEQPLSPEQARAEAGRCYSCGAPFGKYRTCWFCLPCEVECPQEALWVDIPYLLR